MSEYTLFTYLKELVGLEFVPPAVTTEEMFIRVAQLEAELQKESKADVRLSQ